MYRILDNKDGKILALCFDEDLAARIVGLFPHEYVEGDDETIRFVYEDCMQDPQSQIGNVLMQMGNAIQMRHRSH